MVSIDFIPLFAPWLLIIFAILASMVAGYWIIYRQRGAFMRIIAIALIYFALFDPALKYEKRQPLRSIVALIVDRSQSQTLEKRRQQSDKTIEILKQRLDKLSGFDVRIVDAHHSIMQNHGTQLFSAIAHNLQDIPPERIAGVILISDGEVHDIPINYTSLGFNAPIHALITGHANEQDRQLNILKVPRFGIVGTTQTIEFKIEDHSNLSKNKARITIRQDGHMVIEETIKTEIPAKLSVTIDHAGDNIFEVEVESLDDELTPINNSTVIKIKGIRENLRVLLVSGEPNSGERAWRNLLKSDAAVDLVHFTILRPPEKHDGTPINELSLIAFPTRELFSTKIDDFDLIIFDRYRKRGVLPLLYFDNIARYVEDGGAVLVAVGPDYANASSIYQSPLASILPAAPSGKIIEQAFHPRVSTQGLKHPVTRNLPGAAIEPPDWGRWFRVIDTTIHQGDVLMTAADNHPLLVLHRQGEGRIAMLLSDHAWLWARHFEGGGPYVTLLRRTAHWLMKEPDLEEEKLHATVEGQAIIIKRQSMHDKVETFHVISPSGIRSDISPKADGAGLWRASIQATELGLWRIEEGNRTALAHVGPLNPREFQNVLSTPKKLGKIVHASGGLVQRISSKDDTLTIPRIIPIRSGNILSGQDWMGLKVTKASILKNINRWPLFNSIIGLALLLGILSMTWWREGR